MNIVTLCLSTTLQRTAFFNRVNLNEINRSVRFRLDASGKAVNVCRVLNQLQKDCATVICPVGQDNAEFFLSLAGADRLPVTPVLIPGATRECVTIIEQDGNRITELVMDEASPTDEYFRSSIAKAEQQLIAELESAFKTCDAFAFAGSRPKIWSKNLNADICTQAVKAGLIVLVDFWGEDLLSVLQSCTPHIIKINAQEFCETFTVPKDFDILQNAVCEKSREFQNCIVITRGKDPTLAACKGIQYVQPTEHIEPVNTIGCGDSFSAGFLYEYMTSLQKAPEADILRALRKGNSCATQNATTEKVGSIL